MLAGIQSNPWVYPTLEALHILGIALLVGNLVALEMRVFGRVPSVPVRPFARLSVSIALTGFALAATTGLLMFSTQVQELWVNRAFRLKMCFLLIAGCNAAWFHGRRSLARMDGLARVQMLLSTGLWIAVIFCGRWIAY